jgi:uncharacterized Zn-binding protein involved in type VI secretion
MYLSLSFIFNVKTLLLAVMTSTPKTPVRVHYGLPLVDLTVSPAARKDDAQQPALSRSEDEDIIRVGRELIEVNTVCIFIADSVYIRCICKVFT